MLVMNDMYVPFCRSLENLPTSNRQANLGGVFPRKHQIETQRPVACAMNVVVHAANRNFAGGSARFAYSARSTVVLQML